MDMPYQIDLVTLDYVRAHRRLAASATTDDDLLQIFITEASAEFCEAIGRVPHPYIASKDFGIDRRWNSYQLNLADDLLAVTSITNGDDAAITTGYILAPNNVYPKDTVLLSSSGGTTWVFDDNDDMVTIAGIYGYVKHYTSGAWRTLTTLTAAMTDSVTTLPVTAGLLETGQYVLVGSEQMYVIDKATNTVQRGVNGTTAASHLISSAVKYFDQLADIRAAVRDLVVYKYLSKDAIGAQVTTYEGGRTQVLGLPESYQKTILRHTRQQEIRAV